MPDWCIWRPMSAARQSEHQIIIKGEVEKVALSYKRQRIRFTGCGNLIITWKHWTYVCATSLFCINCLTDWTCALCLYWNRLRIISGWCGSNWTFCCQFFVTLKQFILQLKLFRFHYMTVIQGFQSHVLCFTSANLLPLQKQHIVLLAQYELEVRNNRRKRFAFNQELKLWKPLKQTNYIFILCAALLHFND